MARLARRAGRLDQALLVLDRAEGLARDTGEVLQRALCLCERGHLGLARGRVDRSALDEAEALFRELGTSPESDLGLSLDELRSSIEAAEAHDFHATAPGVLGALERGG